MKVVLDVRNLTLNLAATRVLDTITFQLGAGECAALLGLNGAGKSTLIKVLCHLIPTADGVVLIKKIAACNPKARENIVYLPERFTANPHLTGNTYLSILLQGEIKAVNAIAHALHFDPNHLQQKIATYSKGMLQKLGLLYFFAADKAVKIADEIMSGLDFKTRAQVQDLIQTQQLQGKTFLFSTHMLEDVKAIATRVLYLEKGALIFEGTQEAFLNSPWNFRK
jgi:ABC-type multidrug transport system, ATPase component